MRLWTIHPCYLDAKGLVALWREALLAKAVLSGKTKGYRHHPQLIRFKATQYPLAYMNLYLKAIFLEAQARGYSFNQAKIKPVRSLPHLPAHQGQMDYEWNHLKQKLQKRDQTRYRTLLTINHPKSHPLFRLRPGNVHNWEKVKKKRCIVLCKI
jgi:hypothetical protein